jgi:GNAT superfamily N-acetyltransferase
VNSKLVVCELTPEHWTRLRDLRLAALAESPENLSGKLEEEKDFTEAQWREGFNKLTYLVASIDGVDVGMINVENLKGDFGATCWLGGLWLNPKYRGQGVARALFDYMDSVAKEKDWVVQGLGVMESNDNAIVAFEKFGFVRMGEPQESRGKPGYFYYRMIKAL